MSDFWPALASHSIDDVAFTKCCVGSPICNGNLPGKITSAPDRIHQDYCIELI